MVIVKTMALVDKPMCIQCYRAFKFGLGIDECEFIESIPVTQVTTQQPQQS